MASGPLESPGSCLRCPLAPCSSAAGRPDAIHRRTPLLQWPGAPAGGVCMPASTPAPTVYTGEGGDAARPSAPFPPLLLPASAVEGWAGSPASAPLPHATAGGGGDAAGSFPRGAAPPLPPAVATPVVRPPALAGPPPLGGVGHGEAQRVSCRPPTEPPPSRGGGAADAAWFAGAQSSSSSSLASCGAPSGASTAMQGVLHHSIGLASFLLLLGGGTWGASHACMPCR